MSDLEAIPNGLHHSEVGVAAQGVPDMSTFVLANQREAANLGYAYPAQFSDHVFEGADGERIAASVGLHEGVRRPGLIVVHGLFSSRRFDYVRQIAVRAFFEWGFNVAALDLRSFGLTNLTSAAPTTRGWKEGEDIIACGRYLKELGRPRSARSGFPSEAPLCSAPVTSRALTRASTAASSRSRLPPTHARWPSGCPSSCRLRIRRTPSTSPSGRCSRRASGRRAGRTSRTSSTQSSGSPRPSTRSSRGALAPCRCARAHRRREGARPRAPPQGR